MKVLIIEDKPALAEEYLRIFGHLLNDLSIEFTHVSTIQEASKSLNEQNWGVILVDSELGAPTSFPEGAPKEESIHLGSGFDLVRFRRTLEQEAKGITPSYIVGIPANHVAVRFFRDSGVDEAFLKLEIPRMAGIIRSKAENGR